MLQPELSLEEYKARYKLLCNVSNADPDRSQVQHELAEKLGQLKKIIQQDLPQLARQGSPNTFADIHYNLLQELERFYDFCQFPHLAKKVIIGLGGDLGAGKSSLINALVGKNHLSTEINTKTSLPTYLFKSEKASITALNLFKCHAQLSKVEFLSLIHDEKYIYSSQALSLLQSAYISLPDFPFERLALLDTPSYSAPNDVKLARAQLNSAQLVVWVVSAEIGTILEDDLNFLGSLEKNIPCLVILSRADKRPPKEISNLLDQIQNTLASRAIFVIDVLPFSNCNENNYPLEPILQHLDDWDKVNVVPAFASNFKREFTIWNNFIEGQQRLANHRLNRLNSILKLSEIDAINLYTEELKEITQQDLYSLQEVKKKLYDLRQEFFINLKMIGNELGIKFPDPKNLDLLNLKKVDLADLLRQEREARNLAEPDMLTPWHSMTQPADVQNLEQLIIREQYSHKFADTLTQLEVPTNYKQLLREKSTDIHGLHNYELPSSFSKPAILANYKQLLRKKTISLDFKSILGE